MATKDGNGAMEMGTSDQVLVAANKQKRRRNFIIGGVVMGVAIVIAIVLVATLSGNGGSSDAGEAQPIVSTEGPTTAIYTTEPTTTPATTPASTTTEPTTTTTTEPTTTQAPSTQIQLDDVINGAYTPAGFNATWASGSEVLFRGWSGELILYDVDTDSSTVLVQNTSEILQRASRVTELSADGTTVIISYDVIPIYRYSFIARYSAVDVLSNTEVDIIPPGVEAAEAFLQNFVWGPTGTSCAFVYLNNVYYKSSLTADAVAITTTGQQGVLYHGIPDWVYEEEVFVSSNAMWFSKDGEKLAYASFDDSEVRVMRVPFYGVPGSVDYQYTRHREIRYPKPGTTNPNVYVTLRDVATTTTNTYSAPGGLEQPILKTVSFVTNESIAVMWTNRVQNELVVELCTYGTTACTEIFTYTESEGWIDNIPLIFNEAGDSFVTILPQTVDEERYKQVVQVSSATAAAGVWGAASRTPVAHTVLDILKWTDDDIVWYKATSVNDSSYQHIYSVDASQNVNCFSCSILRTDGAACLYNDGLVNEDGSRITVNCAGPEVPQVFVYDSNSNLVRVWDTNEELSQSLSGIVLPEVIRLSVPVATGYPDADVQIIVPEGYASRTDVPLLVYVYGGPETSLVTQAWALDWARSLVSRSGVAVASVDGRGSGLRGLHNTFALNRQLGSVEVEDQIEVTRWLQQNLGWVSANRTCIWGWSYGGYAASLALARGGDVFRCAIAVAPVVDWRFYDTIYTERYMDVPENNTIGYSNSSLLTAEVVEAYRNKAYMLVHGTADDNVHYQHAMLLSRLLQRNDVLFDQMTYTDEDHALAAVRPHLYHGIEKFLEENLL